MGEDPGSEVEPKGHEHEVKNLLYHEVIFRGRIVLEFFDSSFRLQYSTNIFEGLSSYCMYKSLHLKMTVTDNFNKSQTTIGIQLSQSLLLFPPEILFN